MYRKENIVGYSNTQFFCFVCRGLPVTVLSNRFPVTSPSVGPNRERNFTLQYKKTADYLGLHDCAYNRKNKVSTTKLNYWKQKKKIKKFKSQIPKKSDFMCSYIYF